MQGPTQKDVAPPAVRAGDIPPAHWASRARATVTVAGQKAKEEALFKAVYRVNGGGLDQ